MYGLIGENPVISRIMQCGYPYPEPENHVCPECGEELFGDECVYKTWEAFGCERCVERIDVCESGITVCPECGAVLNDKQHLYKKDGCFIGCDVCVSRILSCAET